MTLQAVLDFVEVVPNSAGGSFATQVAAQISQIYQQSPTMRSALEARVSSEIPLSIEFVVGVQRNVRTSAGSTLVSDAVQIDPTYSDATLSIDQFGNVAQRGFPYMLVHELCHALFSTLDPLVSQVNQPNFDFLGDTVRKENVVLREMGFTDERVGYFSTFPDYVSYRNWYTDGSKIDYAFKNDLGLAYVDASVSLQKNLNGLLIGNGSSDALTGGNGNDYLWGIEGDDVLSGGLGRDFLLGGGGADSLDGGKGDDFIFFDAADTSVKGGLGKDAAFVTTTVAVNSNLTTMRVEWLVGNMGNDSIRAGTSTDTLLFAGGDGADVIRVGYGAGEGIRVVWGGDGADKFYFTSPGGDANQTWQTPAGILVVTVTGLTVENFAGLTLGHLGLGALDLSKFAAIVLNPDSSDRFFVDGTRIDATALAADPNLQPNDGGTVFTVRQTDWLGPDLDVQAIFEDRTLITPTPDVTFYELGGVDDDNFIVVNGQTIDEGTWGVVWGSEGQPDLLMTEEEAQDYIDNFNTAPYWQEPTDPRPYGPFFVAGGSFAGQSLSLDGTFSAGPPPDPGIADFIAMI